MTSAPRGQRENRRSAPARKSARSGVLLVSVALAACGGQEALGVRTLDVVGAGVVNDPANKSLRFDLLKFGLERFCDEMRRRGAALEASDTEPVMGRFFADGCHAQVLDEERRQSIVVRYSGRGYGWTNLSHRLGFESAGVLEYAVDFQRHDDALYVYFRPRNIGSASFKTLLVESPLAQVGLGLSGVSPDQIGREVLEAQLMRGFTVIRHSERGETEIGPGLIPLGQRPFRPFTVHASDKRTLDNDRTEVHAQQQDFIGGLVASDGGGALTLTMSVDGVPAVDVFVLSEAAALTMLRSYVTRPGAALLAGPPVFEAVLGAGAPSRWQVRLPAGVHYLLIDHSDAVGRTRGPDASHGDRAAKVDYLVQVE